MSKYQPPFHMTDQMGVLIAEISEQIGRITVLQGGISSPHLRRENRIRTIQASLAIENNSLSLEQVTAILDGKRVLGNPNEIREIQNAYEAYEMMLRLNPASVEDLLMAHKLMMNRLVPENGRFRSGGVGIFDGAVLVHMAPPAQFVPEQIQNLFAWYQKSQMHPLIKSAIFHYEFEFIHPFADGNGRMGRLWQTVILKDWKEIFAWLPVETLIKEHQEEYYQALRTSDIDANSTKFIEFMLSLIFNTIEEIMETEKKVTEKVSVKVTENQKKIMDAIKENPFVTQDELVGIVGIARKNIISNMKRLQENGFIKRIGADKNGYWQVEE